MPNIMPTLFVKDSPSLNIISPAKTTTIMFKTVKIVMDFDSASNFKEYAQTSEAITYRLTPINKKVFLLTTAHCLSNTSAAASKITAIKRIIKNSRFIYFFLAQSVYRNQF